ncbi:MAG: hypothetical protein WC516_02090 [Patescibacteria group bacterium]
MAKIKKFFSQLGLFCKTVCGKICRKKKDESKKNPFKVGLILGLVVALIVIIIILLVVFGGRIFGGDSDATGANKKLDIKITVLTKKDCPECWDVNLFIDALKQKNIKNSKAKTVYIDSSQGKKLIDQYKITKVPTVLLSGDLTGDADLKAGLAVLGDIVDKVFVLRQIIPPYIDVKTGEEKGKLAVIYLTDSSCKTCYDVNLHADILKNKFVIEPKVAKTVDVNSDEGKQLVTKYKIKFVPTFLLQGQVSEYTGLEQIWSQIGQVASDGTYIFTQVDQMGTYKDLTKNKTITPPPAEAQPSIQPVTSTKASKQ